MERTVKTKVKGFRTTDGAVVNLVRVLENQTIKEFYPIYTIYHTLPIKLKFT